MKRQEWKGLGAYEDRFLMCRVYQHAWDSLSVRTDGAVAATCLRCGVSRTDRIDDDYRVTSRSYSYPEGYTIPKDYRPDRSYFRHRLLGARGLAVPMKGGRRGRSSP